MAVTAIMVLNVYLDKIQWKQHQNHNMHQQNCSDFTQQRILHLS